MRSIFLIFLALFFTSAAANPPAKSFDRMDAAFPNISFVNPDGDRSTLADYKGKVVVVKLWATWCGICRAKWPEHQALYDSVKNDADIQVITISVAEEQQVSQDWVDKQGFNVPLFKNLISDRGAVLVDDESFLFIQGTPTKFLIDKEGVLRKKVVGKSRAISEADIRGLI